MSLAEQNYNALQQKLIGIQDQLDSKSLDYDRQNKDWRARHEEQLNHINSLQSDLGRHREQLQDNRLVSMQLLYPPSERSECGLVEMLFSSDVCLCLCVCLSVRSGWVIQTSLGVKC